MTVAQDVCRLLQVNIAEAQAEVTWEQLPVVQGDDAQLTQLLQNLIGNGIKYVERKNPQVTVSAIREGDAYVVTVEDNGIGIKTEDQERVFQIFKRLHTSEEYPGTGLGLALCRRIVERHGGRIWVESVPGQGSRFQFTLKASSDLPLHKGAGSAEPTIHRERHEAT